MVFAESARLWNAFTRIWTFSCNCIMQLGRLFRFTCKYIMQLDTFDANRVIALCNWARFVYFRGNLFWFLPTRARGGERENAFSYFVSNTLSKTTSAHPR